MMIDVKRTISHTTLPINTPLQAIAVSFNECGLKSLCSVYIPPNDQILDQQIEQIIDQLPKPKMIFGDMNAQYPMWYDGNLDARGMTIQSVIETKNLAVLNEDQHSNITNCNYLVTWRGSQGPIKSAG